MTTRVGLIAMLLVGCSPKPAEPLVNPAQVPHEEEESKLRPPPLVRADRPVLEVAQLRPDFHDELRWPLTAMSHPSLEPRYAIAARFADPGVDWLELCQGGVQHRVIAGRPRDELDYLRGWCSAVKGDADAACGKLAPLVSSTVLGMPAAVRLDVATIIAEHGDIAKAEHLLAKNNIRDIELLDTLAATYVELGHTADAYEVNRRAIDSDVNPPLATHCRRLVRALVLGGDTEFRLKQLEAATRVGKIPDETCERLYHAAQCWSPAIDCAAYFKDNGIDDQKYAWLVRAYEHWPKGAAHADLWLDVALDAARAVPLAGAEDMAEAAFDAALKSAPACDPRVVWSLGEATKYLKSQQLRAAFYRCPAPPPRD